MHKVAVKLLITYTILANLVHSLPQNNYPVRMIFVEDAKNQSNILPELLIPNISPPNIYNYVVYQQWSIDKVGNSALQWQNIASSSIPEKYGKTGEERRKSLKLEFTNNNVKLLLDAFGNTSPNITIRSDFAQCAQKLAKYVKDYLYDGVVISAHDDKPFLEDSGDGQTWLINFTFALRKLLPNHIIIHSLFPYQMVGEQYNHGGYLKINRAVGHLINFYLLIYDKWVYQNYTEIFVQGPPLAKIGYSSISELAIRGISINKIAIRRQVDTAQAIGNWMMQAYSELGWFAGLALVCSNYCDLGGDRIEMAARSLLQACNKSPCIYKI